MSRSHSGSGPQEPWNGALISMLQVMMNQQNAAQEETKTMLGHFHSRAEATHQRIGRLEQAVEATYSRLEARIEQCKAGEASTNITNERFDEIMKSMTARHRERDKRLEKLEEAHKAASSAATAAQETAGRAAAAAAQIATTRPASEAENGGRGPHRFVLIAGFQRDTH